MSHLVLKYVARASVAIPFVIALGFALAAVAVMLVERFGHVTAYWIMAGGLAAIGAIAAIAVSVKEHEEEVAEQKAEQADTGEVVERCHGPGHGAGSAGAPRRALHIAGRRCRRLQGCCAFSVATFRSCCCW